MLRPNEKFRLWATTEMHPNFPTILLQSSLKITYEVKINFLLFVFFLFKIILKFENLKSPPGIKKNIQRAYENWSNEFIAKNGLVYRSQALFVLAWFHAIIQERRNYIPQV